MELNHFKHDTYLTSIFLIDNDKKKFEEDVLTDYKNNSDFFKFDKKRQGI